MILNKILHKKSKTFPELNKIKHRLTGIYDDVYSQIDYAIIQEIMLPSIKYKDGNESIEEKIISSGVSEYRHFLSRFTPKSILKSIIENYNYIQVHKYVYQSNTILFYVYNRIRSKYNINKLRVKAQKALAFMEYFGLENKTAIVHFAPTLFKKCKPTMTVIDIENVNSGFTTHTFTGSGVITIFREEESDKVLLHELVHLFGLDFSMSNIDSINNDIMKTFNVNKDIQYINFFEAFTESVAVIFNACFNCIITNSDEHRYFITELFYMGDTILLILDIFNMENLEDLTKKGNLLIQRTSVLSYYILKYGLLRNVDKFIQKFLYIKSWNDSDIRGLLKLSKEGLRGDIVNYNLNNGSLRMTYNDIRY